MEITDEDRAKAEALEAMMRARVAREQRPQIPPEHIVTGNCTFEALNRYLALHPFETIRAHEAIQMMTWLYPYMRLLQADNPSWGILDITGEKLKTNDDN